MRTRDRFEDTHPEIANQRFYRFKELTFSSTCDARLAVRRSLAARIREWQTLLASSVKSDKRVSIFGGTEDFATAIATLLTAVDRRRSLIEGALSR